MKGEKIRIIFIYILIAVIIGLVCYLIFNFFNNSSREETKATSKTDSGISADCTFNMTTSEYNNAINGGNDNICGGYNKIIIKDVVLDNKNVEVSVIYYNGNLDENDTQTGMYLDNKRIIKYAAKNYKNNIGVFNNKLFIFTIDNSKPNVLVYGSDNNRVYDLETALLKAKISDPAFTEIAKTHSNLDTVLKNSIINSGSFNFGNDGFTFSTSAKTECVPGEVIGSSYKVLFDGTNFSAPQFVSLVNCNG